MTGYARLGTVGKVGVALGFADWAGSWVGPETLTLSWFPGSGPWGSFREPGVRQAGESKEGQAGCQGEGRPLEPSVHPQWP